MRRYFKMNNGRTEETHVDQADQVLIDKTELDAIERKLQNKTEEAARWARKLTGEGLDYRIVSVDYIDGGFRSIGYSKLVKEPARVFVTISLPVAYQLNKATKDKAKEIVEYIFNPYLSKEKRYKLHFTPKSGWSVNLEMTEEELESFQLPN